MGHRRGCRAFSLGELLVVLAVVAALAAILFPVLIMARRAAAKTTCLSNERQLGQAMLLYVESNDDLFPDTVTASPGSEWAHVLLPYVKSHGVYVCPADPTQPPTDWRWGGNPRDVMSYGLNSNLPGVHLRRPRSADTIMRDTPAHSSLAATSRTVMFFEVTDAIADLERTSTERSDDGAPIFTDGPTGNTASNPAIGAVAKGQDAQDYPMGQSALGPEPMVRYATGNVGGRVLNLGKGSQARHGEVATYLACDGHASALHPRRVSGGSDAADASCAQGTLKGQLGACAAQRGVSAAGTDNGTYALTFSAR